MAIEFYSVEIVPSKVNALQGFLVMVKVALVALLRDSNNAILHDSTGVRLIAKQEVA